MSSHFYYIHKDIGGDPNFWKAGVTVHPSNVVRGIQRKQSRMFFIDHLYFGIPHHIIRLESSIKEKYRNVSGRALFAWGNQTELFRVDIHELLSSVEDIIVSDKLDVRKLLLKTPYFGVNTKTCSLKLPSERDLWYFEDKAQQLFGKGRSGRRTSIPTSIEKLFEDQHA